MMYQKALSPPSGGDPLAKYQQQQHQPQQRFSANNNNDYDYDAEDSSDVNAHEAVAWNSLCDQFTLNLLKLEMQLSETSYRTELVEEEAALRVFIYNSLLFGITSHSARLSSHFSELMDDVRSLQNNHERLQHDKQSHASQIAEYHAKMILEQRSQAEMQAISYQSKIESLRQDERDLRIRVETLRQETEETQDALDRRRNESLEERRVLENELQRLHSEVGNQKYNLDRLNAQVDTTKQRLRENERMIIERSVLDNNSSMMMMAASTNINNNNNHSNSRQSPVPSSAAPLPRQSQQSQYYQEGGGTYHAMPQPMPSASPDRHGDSIASGVSHVQAVRDNATDATFLRLGKVTPVRVPPQFHAALLNNSNNNNISENIHNSNNSYHNNSGTAGLSSVASRMVSNPRENVNERTPIPATASYTRPANYATSSLTTPTNAPRNNGIANGSLFEANNNNGNSSSKGGSVMMMNPNSNNSNSNQPSQWQMRLMKLQGELKSLKNDLGVASPK